MPHTLDEQLYRLVIGDHPERAAVHRTTGSLDEVILRRDGDDAFAAWLNIYRRSLERDGLTSEVDYETKHFADADTLDDFAEVNVKTRVIEASSGLTLVDTDAFESRQDACDTIKECTGWWRFTQVGYNRQRTQAFLHTDYDHPQWGLMGTGQFVLLQQENGKWSVVAKDMTWMS